MTTGRITDIEGVQDDWNRPGGIRNVVRARLTVEITAQDLQHIDIGRPITITQEGEQ